MVFPHPENGSPVQIYHLGLYHPWRRGTNPDFDSFSGTILDLKDGLRRGIDFFFNELDPMLGTNFPIVVVPSHDPQKTGSGILTLAQCLARNQRIDARPCIFRHSKIEKLAHGGHRGIDTHRNSIGINREHLIRQREVLLLDDVTTSGTSIMACEELLLAHGALGVTRLVLGKTA